MSLLLDYEPDSPPPLKRRRRRVVPLAASPTSPVSLAASPASSRPASPVSPCSPASSVASSHHLAASPSHSPAKTESVAASPSPPASPAASDDDYPNSPELDLDFEALGSPPRPIPYLHGSIPPSIARFLPTQAVIVHSNTLAVVCLQEDGFTFVNGFFSISLDTYDMDGVMNVLLQLQVSYVLCTDLETQKKLDAALKFFEFRTGLQDGFIKKNIGKCPYCLRLCHRFKAFMCMSYFQRYRMDMPRH